MLSNYMKSNEYYEMIEKAVDSKKVFKAVGKEFDNALNKLGLDIKTHDSIEGPAILMMCAARTLYQHN